jgi:hypothetical protein
MTTQNILIVDDSATTRAIIKRTIALAGLTGGDVYEAPSGTAALEVLRTRRVDVVLTDLHMPGMGGVELTRRMQADPAMRPIRSSSCRPSRAPPGCRSCGRTGCGGSCASRSRPNRCGTPSGACWRWAMGDNQFVTGTAEPGAPGAASSLADLRAALPDVVADALDAMAFVAALPAGPPSALPAELVVCDIAFGGPLAGRLEAVLPLDLARVLAANLLGTAPDDPECEARAGDAVQEVLNVVCGRLLARLPERTLAETRMDLPRVRPAEAGEWAAVAAHPHAITFDADGHPLAVRLTGAE